MLEKCNCSMCGRASQSFQEHVALEFLGSVNRVWLWLVRVEVELD